MKLFGSGLSKRNASSFRRKNAEGFGGVSILGVGAMKHSIRSVIRDMA